MNKKIVLVFAGLFIALGLLLLFVPRIQTVHLCYLICALVIAAGVILIVRYFMSNSFTNLNEYSFSEGVLLLILGMCGLVRTEQLVTYFLFFLGISALLSSVIKLQYALDLKQIKDKMWMGQLAVGLVLSLCSALIIINPFSKEGFREDFTYSILLLDGILTLVSNFYLQAKIKQYERAEVQREELLLPEEEIGKAEEPEEF